MNLKKSAQIRRTVENVAYSILEDRPEPELDYDGDIVEHWDIEAEELHPKVLKALEYRHEIEEGDDIDRTIAFHCEDFIEHGLEDMQQRFREGLQDRHERKRYEQSHQPTWKPWHTRLLNSLESCWACLYYWWALQDWHSL